MEMVSVGACSRPFCGSLGNPRYSEPAACSITRPEHIKWVHAVYYEILWCFSRWSPSMLVILLKLILQRSYQHVCGPDSSRSVSTLPCSGCCLGPASHQYCLRVLRADDDVHFSVCIPAGFEVLCGFVMQIYKRVAVAKWIKLYDTVPHSPTTPALVWDLTPCPKMKRLTRQLQRDFGLRTRARAAPV